jgi:hypothetical protein
MRKEWDEMKKKVERRTNRKEEEGRRPTEKEGEGGKGVKAARSRGGRRRERTVGAWRRTNR